MHDKEAELSFMFGKTATLFTSKQRALEAVLEALGVPMFGTPVILPALAPIELVTAVLRAGGLPLVLDVNALVHHQYDYVALKEALAELEEAVVVFWRPFGETLDQLYLDLCKEFVTVQIADIQPFEPQGEVHKTTFAIYSMKPATAGAVVFSKFEDQRGVLRKVKSGIFGMNDFIPESECAVAVDKLSGSYRKAYLSSMAGIATEWHSELIGNHLYSPVQIKNNYPIEVTNARAAKADLDLREIPSELGAVSITSYPEVRARFSKLPQYPHADMYDNKILVLSCDGFRVSENMIKEAKRLLLPYLKQGNLKDKE